MRAIRVTIFASLLLAVATASASAASVLGSGCIHVTPAGWVAAASQPTDQFVVWAPAADLAQADDAAKTIRAQDFIGYYEDHLSIPRIGLPGQTGKFQILLDPEFHAALPNADGLEAASCELPNTDTVAVYAGLSGEEFHATLAHELFHAAQAQLAGNFADNWFYEATATWAETRFGYQTPDPRGFSKSVTDHPGLPMDSFSQAVEGADAHEYGAWTFVAWLFSRSKINWTKMRAGFVQAAHSDATPILDQLVTVGPSTLGDEVASYWADHTNTLPQFGPTAKLTHLHVGPGTESDQFPVPEPLAARMLAVKPTGSVKQLVVIVKKLPKGVQAWIRTGDNGQFWRLDEGGSFNETFCRTGATPGSFPLPKTGDIRIAITTSGKSASGDVKLKLIASTDPCPKQMVVLPGLAMGPLHLGMTLAEAQLAGPRHTVVRGPLPTPVGLVQSQAFGVDGALVIAEYVDGRIAALIAGGPRARTTTGIFGLELRLPLPLAGSDDPAGPLFDPGSTLAEFGGHDCVDITPGRTPVRYCIREGPPTRYTIAGAVNMDPCPTDGSPTDTDGGDMPVCSYPKEWYVTGLIVVTQKGLALAKYAVSLIP